MNEKDLVGYKAPKPRPVKHVVPGVEGDRKSHRVYTHAVVANRNLVNDRAADLRYYGRVMREQFGFYAGKDARVAALGADGFVAEHMARINAEYDAREAAGNPLFVCQWSMSLAAARKAVGGYINRNYTNVQVREVVRG